MKINIDGESYSFDNGTWTSDSSGDITADTMSRLNSIVESTQTIIAADTDTTSTKKVRASKSKNKIKIFDN